MAERLLRALETPAARIAPTAEGRIQGWRDLLAELAERDRPILLVLDNAADAAQVAPLLPDPPHRALITSRRTLSPLPCHRADLATLTADESATLLDLALRAARPYDTRVADAPDDARRLAELCGHLPLALQIVAALLRDEPERTLGSQIDELGDSRTRLAGLRYDDADEQGRPLAVEAAFALSYGRLPADLAGAFALLGSMPGPDFSLEAAALLLGLPEPEARRRLSGLARFKLLEPRRGERWAWHDLLRLFARALPGPHSAAVERLLTGWFELTLAANARLHTPSPAPEPGRFGEVRQAMAWFDAEYPSLLAGAELALHSGGHDLAYKLALTLTPFLQRHAHLAEAVHAARIAVTAAPALGELPAIGIALNHLGRALSDAREHREAIEVYTLATEVYAAYGNTHGQAKSLTGIAYDRSALGEHGAAIEAHRKAVSIFAANGEIENELQSRASLAMAHYEHDEFARAAAMLREVCAALREMGHTMAEARVLINLGAVLDAQGLPEEAVEVLVRAAESFRRTDDRLLLALAETNLGGSLTRAGRPGEAVPLLESALLAFERAGDHHHTAVARRNLEAARAAART